MSKICEHFREDDYLYFNNMIAQYKGVWSYFKSGYGWKFYITPLPLPNQTQNTATIDVWNSPIEDFDFSIPELGYVNLSGNTQFLKMSPSGGSCMGLQIGKIITKHDYGIDNNWLKQSGFFFNLLQNIYPTFQEVWEKVGAPTLFLGSMKAFHKHFALVRNSVGTVLLLYKDKPIGEAVAGVPNPVFKLYPAYHHLTRKITQEAGIPNVQSFLS